MDISDLRRDYMSQGIEPGSLDSNPFTQFEVWFKQALDADIQDPNAFSLATVNSAGLPTVRTLLLKQFDERGFVFYTNYESRKGQELQANPKVGLLLPWLQLNRQIRIEGTVEKISESESESYFKSRPRESQIGAWCSAQSEEITSREVLESKYQEIEARYEGEELPLPPFWGGYRIIPERFEFWQGRESRLHDRVEYRLVDQTWEKVVLAP